MASWGLEIQISILKKGQQERISETCWEQKHDGEESSPSPRSRTGSSADQVLLSRQKSHHQIKKRESWILTSTESL